MRRRSCTHVTTDQLRAEGRAGLFRSKTDEERSFALAALNEGCTQVETVRSYMQGAGHFLEPAQVQAHLDELVRRTKATKDENGYKAR